MTKIYIHTDLEGVAGIDNVNMVDKNYPDYHKSLENLMLDLNAAIDGAFAGGATAVTVLDSHGGGGNFLMDMLDTRVENDTKPNKKWWGILDESFSATFFIGAHAMAGTINGFLDHTQSSLSWYNYYLNGRKMGEIGQWALVAGAFGVPLTMVSGDEAACVEARQFFNPIETAIVKSGIGRNRAELVDPEEARTRIWEAAKKGVALASQAKPFIPLKPMDIKLEFTRSDHCDSAKSGKNIERLDARTIRKITNDQLDLFPW